MKYTSYEALGRALDGLSEAEQSALQRLERLIVESNDNFGSIEKDFKLSQTELIFLLCDYWNCSEKAQELYDSLLERYTSLRILLHHKVQQLCCFFDNLQHSDDEKNAVILLRMLFEETGSIFKSLSIQSFSSPNAASKGVLLEFEPLTGDPIFIQYSPWFPVNLFFEAFKNDLIRNPCKKGIFKIVHDEDSFEFLNSGSFIRYQQFKTYHLNPAFKIKDEDENTDGMPYIAPAKKKWFYPGMIIKRELSFMSPQCEKIVPWKGYNE